MAGTTTIVGWPYPSASDLIAQGAAKIEELAEAVEAQFFLEKNTFSADKPHTSWPPGMSLMTVSGVDEGWPSSTGMVVTNTNYAQSCAWQYFYPQTASSEYQRAYLRVGVNVSGIPTWSVWQTIASPGTSEEEATGSITISPTAGQPTPAKVSFPSGRFSKNPRVFLQYQGQQPQDVSLSTYDRSTTGFTVYAYRGGSTSVVVHWYAVVMASDAANN